MADVQALVADNPIPRGTAEQDALAEDPIYAEAKRRFEYCLEVESSAVKHFLDDYRFAEGDSDNGYQWPNDLRKARELSKQPSLTINETRQHNLQIINDAKQNKPGIKIRPTGGQASAEAASIWQDIIRHIEYRSNAQRIYDRATEFQVKAGWGYWRIVTDYVSDDSFDQEILLRPIDDPTSVFLDPNAQEPDKSDANYGFIFRDIPKDSFESIYPDLKDEGGGSPLGFDTIFNSDKDHVRVVEYYRRTQVQDQLVSYMDPQTGKMATAKASILPEELIEALSEQEGFKTREVWSTKVEWFLIVGGKVRQTNEWLGKYIPIIILIGEETVIDGVLDRKGHTRAMKDPQRIYNYWTSSAVEQVALQTKTPWVGPAAGIEELETYWNTANTVNHAFLPYRHVDDEGNPLAAPTRTAPPQMAEAYIQGMQISANEMSKVSGQQPASMGVQGNERTGRAIAERQRKGDNSVYHFIDNLALAIQYTGRQLIDLVPKIYDTERVIRMVAEDGEDYEVTVDPKAKQAFAQKQAYTGQVVQRIFNPSLGQYEIEADIGPNYASKREEAWNAYSLILTQNPQLVTVIGDLLFRAADFPFAEEAGARLKRMIPAQATGEGPSQELLAAQASLQSTQAALAASLNKIAEQEADLKEKDRKRDVDEYNAETNRIKALSPFLEEQDPASINPLLKQLVADALDTTVSHKEDGLEGGRAPMEEATDAAPPIPGAKLAPDGHWYAPDPARPGKYLQAQIPSRQATPARPRGADLAAGLTPRATPEVPPDRT